MVIVGERDLRLDRLGDGTDLVDLLTTNVNNRLPFTGERATRLP